jgi:hypothetical protein
MAGPRVYRNITVKLSLINAAAGVYTAVEKPASNHTVCVGNGTVSHAPTQIKQSRACPVEECRNDDDSTFQLVAATSDGAGVLIDKSERDAIREEASKATKSVVELTPHPVESVRANTIPYGSVYYLQSGAGQAWDHLVDAMVRHPELAFLGTWSPQGKPNLYEFRLFEGTPLMVEVARTEAIKVIAQEGGTLDAGMQQAMDTFLQMATKPFDPAAYQSEFDAKMAELLASKAPEETVVLTKSKSGTKEAAPVQDFAATLAASIAAVGDDGKKKPRKKKEAAA